MLKATALLTVKESQNADKATISSGISGEKLMENAGRAVTTLICEQFVPCRTLVVCGTGNNGGDGIVITRLLKERGWPVKLCMVGSSDNVKGDARKVMVQWQTLGNSVPPFSPDMLKGCELVVDALFGTGLARDLEGEAKKAVQAINDSNLPVVAVDIPSGINADSGAVMGAAVRATHTVTFVRAKPGHVLLPGKMHTGRLHIFDIGISGESLAPDHNLNEPRLWHHEFPALKPEANKYTRGHTVVMGAAVRATHTVTFVRAKPGHVLLPGKMHTGRLHIFDIGISGESLAPDHNLNEPRLWHHEFPALKPEANKYTRGHAVVMGGALSSTGAAKLAAMSALRAGSGLVSVTCTADTLPVYAASLISVMTKPVTQLSQLNALIEDKRVTAVLAGPGSGLADAVREQVLLILTHKKPTVLDADALTLFEKDPKALFAAVKGPVVLTPHEGEFSRLFKATGTKPERAQEAAKQSGCVVVLKGNDTIIAAPNGRIAINANAPPWLATAGSGDVLSGIITGLMAQGMAAFEAACCGVWIHGETAGLSGPGMIAEDLPALMPQVMRKLYRHD